jgi:cytochrome c peroxidase
MRLFRSSRAAVGATLALLLGACRADQPTLAAPELDARLVSNKPPTSKATMITLGDQIFEDMRLSRAGNQSCASCHVDAFGFAGADESEVANPAAALPEPFESIGDAFYEGSLNGRFGNRKPPSAAYASFAPPLFFDKIEGTYRGGNFWDGRATGGKGITAIAAQGLKPFASGPEHAFGPACVLWDIWKGPYYADFLAATAVDLSKLSFSAVWTAYKNATKSTANPNGVDFPQGCHNTTRLDPAFDQVIQSLPATLTTTQRNAFNAAFQKVGDALAAYEHSPLVNKFTSKFDATLFPHLAGTPGWTEEEIAGEALFFNGSGCAACHSSIDPRQLTTGVNKQAQIFTDFSYYNLGIPRNPRNPAGLTFADIGLGQTVNLRAFDGWFKSPTVRNVDKRAPWFAGGTRKTYMHNGSLTSLEQVVHFYNTRDVRGCGTGRISETLPEADDDVWMDLPADAPADAPRHLDPEKVSKLTALGTCWPAPDFAAGLITVVIGTPNLVGDLKLSQQQEQQLIAYMKTLSDGYVP